MVWCGVVWCGVVWCVVVWSGVVWCDVKWCDVIWYDIWYDMIYHILSYHIIPHGYELSWVRVVLGTSCPGYELSWVRVVLGTSCPGYELSWVRVVQIPIIIFFHFNYSVIFNEFWSSIYNYCQTSNISYTLVGNKTVYQSDVVGASPISAGPTKSFST